MKHPLRLFGRHAVEAAINYTPQKIITAWIDSSKNDKQTAWFKGKLGDLSKPIHAADRRTLDKMAGGARHQGIVIEIENLGERSEAELKSALENANQPRFFLILDQVQDPHNLGACLRTADAAGVMGIVIAKDRSVGLTPTVFKVACGAAETVPVYRVTNLTRILGWMKTQGIWIVGTDSESQQSAFSVDLSGSIALVLGAEGKGLRRLTREQCDYLVSLPMLGDVESLNLSVTAGVMLYEAIRQRMNIA